MAQDTDELELCPNCGHEGVLQDNTGWCSLCTLTLYPELKMCPCGALFKGGRKATKWCWDCRKEKWLGEHADSIEDCLVSGLGLFAAKKHVADSIRPICNKCGDPIRGGREGSMFCNKKSKCEKAAAIYSALKATGLNAHDALVIAAGKVAVLK